MTITKIKQIAKAGKFHVYVDEKWFGIFLDETLARYKLKTGCEIDEADLSKIKIENDQKLAFDMASGYIEKYVVSEKGIRDYLKKKSFDEKIIRQTIDKLKSYGFVDDEVFAKNYFESMSSGKGKNAIANKLRAKGVSKEIVENLLENVDEEAQLEQAIILAKKFVKNREESPKTKQKCLAHLIYKGYDFSVAQQATNAATDMTYEGENDDWI